MSDGAKMRRHPARDKAEKLIKRLLQAGDIDTLPSVRELSRQSGASPATVWKVISHLHKEKQLVTRWGHEVRIVKKGADPKQPAENSKKRKWQLIREKISNDFLNGYYKPGTLLPASKELQRRYSVSYPTVRKVLTSLQSAGSIESAGSGFKISRYLPERRWRPKIVLICAGSRSGIPKIDTEREREFFYFLSLEASQVQVNLEHIIYEDWGQEPVFYAPHKGTGLTDDDSVLGYILSSWHIRDYTECLRRLSIFRKPVAVWIENTITDVKMMHSQRAFFNIGYSTIPGRRMGEHFLKLGHREIAYLSPFHRSKWSQERCAGLFEAFKDMGASFKVHPFTESQAASEWDFLDLAEKMNSIREQEKLLSTISGSLHSCLSHRVEQFRYEGIKLLRDSLILQSMEKHLLHILENKDITAIIAANDLCALLVLDYLRSLKVDVPRQISLAGFDNTFDSLTNRLTTYSFNTHSLVRAMVRHATGDPFASHPREVQFFEGEVIERATTRAC